MKRKKDRPNLVTELLTAKADLSEELSDETGLYAEWLRQTGAGVGIYSTPALTNLTRKWNLSLRVSENVAITSDLVRLIQMAGDDLPDDFVAQHHDLYAEHGFVYLETPISDEIHQYPVWALSWHHGTGVSERGGSERGEPWYAPDVVAAKTVEGIEINLWTRQPDVNVLLPGGSDFLPYGMPSRGWVNIPEGAQKPKNVLSGASRFILTLQSFLAAELPASTRWASPRAMNTMFRRLDWPIPTVTVIDLRRRAQPPKFESVDAEKAWTLQSRFMVRGHWHSYWVGPKHARHSGLGDGKELIHLYLHPYVKGPEDAPLVITEKVALVRR
jgi:hypothetical protein